MTGDDNESTGDTWIALAVVQWKTGRLIPEVKERALEAIAAETQERWIESGLWNRRRKVLAHGDDAAVPSTITGEDRAGTESDDTVRAG
jgi:hypothetical protein